MIEYSVDDEDYNTIIDKDHLNLNPIHIGYKICIINLDHEWTNIVVEHVTQFPTGKLNVTDVYKDG